MDSPKLVTILVFNSEKKHSVRYDVDPSIESPALTSAYVMWDALRSSGFKRTLPRKIRVTIEEVVE